MPPVNDDFADAIELVGASGTEPIDNTGATYEAGEPANALGADGLASVWYKIVLGANGGRGWDIHLDTDATPEMWDSTLEAFTGSSLGTLTGYANNDDIDFPANIHTALDLAAVPDGTTLYVRVDAYDVYPGYTIGPYTGDGVLTWSVTAVPAPPAPPTITDVSPDPQVVGETIVITGTNFDTVTGVTVGGFAASFVVDSPTQITATIPASSGEGTVVVTNPDGSDSQAITLWFYGPWIQPPDQWSGWIGNLNGHQIWQTTFADTDPYPSLPGTADAPNASTIHGDNLGLGTSGWAVYRVNQVGADWTEWGWEIVEYVIGVNFDADPRDSAPPVRPSIEEQTAPNVVDFETELTGGGTERGNGPTAHGEPLGDVQIKVDLHPSGNPTNSPYATERVAIARSDTPPDSSDVEAGHLLAIRLEPVDYDFPTPTSLEFSQWLTHTRAAALAELLSQPVAAGALEAQSFPPTPLWGSHNDDPANLTLDLTLDDLDPGSFAGAYVAAVAPDLFVDNNPASLPDYLDGSSGKPQVGKSVGGFGSTYSLLGQLWYRPPRYRMLYSVPLGRAPLGHRQRWDGTATVGPPLGHFQGAIGTNRPDLAHRQNTP